MNLKTTAIVLTAALLSVPAVLAEEATACDPITWTDDMEPFYHSECWPASVEPHTTKLFCYGPAPQLVVRCWPEQEHCPPPRDVCDSSLLPAVALEAVP